MPPSIPQPAPPPTDDTTRSGLPSRTTPTWEMELLLSGATVFGLLQLPDKLDRWFYAWINAGDPVVSSFVLALGVYVQFAVFVLAITFVLHLGLRAYWIALVGLHSVFPAATGRKDTRFGPHMRAAQARTERPVPEAIERADNRATIVFAVGVGLALAIVVPMLVALVGIGLATLAGAVGLDVYVVRTGVVAVILALLLPLMLAAAIDRNRGERIAADSRAGRALGAVFAAYGKLGMLRGGSSLLNLFAGNVGGGRGQALVLVLVAVAMFGVGLRMVGLSRGLGGDAHLPLPRDNPESADNLYARFYDTLRPETPTIAPMPYINGPVVEGSYLKLFIPYRPRRHDDAMRAACGDRGNFAAMRCFATLVPVTLDGKPLEYEPIAASDPQGGQRGVLAMIRVEGLAPGRHELTVQAAPNRGSDAAPKLYRIPFWR
jgi:hypothetical protein